MEQIVNPAGGRTISPGALIPRKTSLRNFVL